MADDDPPDADLIDSARKGDESDFESLMRRYSDPIRRLIARYFRNRSMIDDIAQETFVRAYYGLSSFRNDSPFVYWLKKIAVRLCLDEMRRRKARGAIHEDSVDLIADGPMAEDPEKRIEARLLLDKVLGTLSALDRMIVVLLYGEGFSTKEIAGLTGLSITGVKVRAFRIRRRLKELYTGDAI